MPGDARDQPAALPDHLGYWLRTVSNQVSHAFARRLADTGVTVAEWVALRTLYDHDEITPTQLADAMHMTKGAISRLAERLIDKQLVERSDHPADRRAHTLRLSPDGRRRVPELAALADANDAHFFGHLPEPDRQHLEATLRDLAARSGAPPPVD